MVKMGRRGFLGLFGATVNVHVCADDLFRQLRDDGIA